MSKILRVFALGYLDLRGNLRIVKKIVKERVFIFPPIRLYGSMCFYEGIGFTALTFIKQKQPFRGALRKRCSENSQQIFRRTPCRSVISIKLFCNFSIFVEITLRHGCSPLNLLHIFRTPFS